MWAVLYCFVYHTEATMAVSPLSVHELTKDFYVSSRWLFGKKTVFHAVKGISFELREGEILGFLGPNGAGKTTTIQMLLDLLTPTSGTITYFGQNLAQHKDVRQHIAYASGYMKLPSSLTVRQSLVMQGMLYGMSSSRINEKIDELVRVLRLEQLCNQKVSTLSAGQTTIVLVARAFLVEPRIILFDEPTAALDPENAAVVRDFIMHQNKEHGVSILFTSHNMAEVADLCDRILVIKDGNIVANSTPEQLAATVNIAHVQLVLASDFDRWHAFATQERLTYAREEHHIEIEIEERNIADLLMRIAHAGISYSQIAIEKPTLEDYFLLMARKERV